MFCTHLYLTHNSFQELGALATTLTSPKLDTSWKFSSTRLLASINIDIGGMASQCKFLSKGVNSRGTDSHTLTQLGLVRGVFKHCCIKTCNNKRCKCSSKCDNKYSEEKIIYVCQTKNYVVSYVFSFCSENLTFDAYITCILYTTNKSLWKIFALLSIPQICLNISM